MFTSGTLAQIGGNLSSLGAKKLTILAFVGAIILAGVAAVGVVLNQPTSEVLYSGLNAKDLNQMRVVLADAGIPFSVN
ncbi:MAG: flagellar basal-body MS-ring/collar protein FliF, partial [Hyphomicrobiaceae bacterium]